MRFIRYIAAILLVVLVQACGGSSNNSSPTATVSGVAATGAAMDGTVTLKDSTGNIRSVAISLPSGVFNMDVSGLTPPYFLKATNSAGTLTLYSVATGSGTFNINPLSNLVVVAAAMSIDHLAKTPDAAFNNPADFGTLTAAQIQAATDSVMSQMSPAFKAALAANDVTKVNPLTDSYWIGNGLDKVFDGFVVTLNTTSGEVQELQVASNTTAVIGLVDMLGTFPSAGVYDGTVTMPLSSGGTHLVRDMLITSSGEMRYVMDNGIQVVATMTASGSTVTGTGIAYAPTLNGQSTNFQFADDSQAVNLTINGTLGTGTFSGTYTYGSFSDTFSFSLNTQQTNSTASLDKIAGTYASSLDSNTVFIGHIEANGNIWGSGPGIGYSGLIQVVDPNANIYRVTLAYLQNGTYGYVSGLATFHDVAPATSLPMPTALVATGYTCEIASLSYSSSTSGSQGELVMLLSSPSQQISLGAVRMSSQQQTIAVQPTASSLIIQVIGNSAFSLTTVGDTQLGFSGEISVFSGAINVLSGTLNVISNPGNIALNGPNQIAIPMPSAIASSILSIPSNLPVLQSQVINWQSFNITPVEVVNFAQQSSSQAILNNVTVSGDIITGTLISNGGGNIMLSNTDAIVGTGTTGVSVTSMTGTMAGNYSLSGGTLTLSGSAGAMISPVVLVNAGTTTSGGATFASETTGTGP